MQPLRIEGAWQCRRCDCVQWTVLAPGCVMTPPDGWGSVTVADHHGAKEPEALICSPCMRDLRLALGPPRARGPAPGSIAERVAGLR